MRKTLMGVVSAVALAFGLSTSPVAAQDWNGCYLGVQGGYGSGNLDLGFSGVNGLDLSMNGILAGLTGGCDVHVSQRFVIGALADIEWSNIEASLDGDSLELDMKWALLARAGYLLTPTSMLYVLAGYTWTDLGGSMSNYVDDMSGLTIGGGLETQFTPNWGTKLEYRYTNFDDVAMMPYSFDIDAHEIKLGLVYRFGGSSYDPLK